MLAIYSTRRIRAPIVGHARRCHDWSRILNLGHFRSRRLSRSEADQARSGFRQSGHPIARLAVARADAAAMSPIRHAEARARMFDPLTSSVNGEYWRLVPRAYTRTFGEARGRPAMSLYRRRVVVLLLSVRQGTGDHDGMLAI